MAKTDIVFERDKLTEKEKDLYNQMNEKQKASFEKNWISLEKQKLKMKQAQARMTKLKNATKEKERKERAHRLIELGATIEKTIRDTDMPEETVKHLIEIGAAVERHVKITDVAAFDEYIKKYAQAIRKYQAPAHQAPAPQSSAVSGPSTPSFSYKPIDEPEYIDPGSLY